MFITVLMGIYDVADQKLRLVSAGHNPMLLYRVDARRVSRLNPPGMPLGVPAMPDQRFEDAVEEVEWQLGNGDAFILYTDGITEAVDREGAQYGLDRLEKFLFERWDSESGYVMTDLTADLINEIDSFSGFAHQRDDITFIVGRVVDPVESGTDGVGDTPEAIDSQTMRDETDSDQQT